ncbi:hypothetical protein PHLCEN_2v7338 [Hermanssonia centrifuga]|uniref:3-beta hydroxysteroid dehydrogenase/isomerase domain-containing protein n=1 Tax=Hermanssonia centrifuga TaxID=98765 RepID=A0A2R6NWS5_9APHY|nr:hypothetical protein PHLCEN_2v7338 [Hermanssonia centrifuga]
MSAIIWLVSLLTPFVLCLLYVLFNDKKLVRIPPEATAISPKRWANEDVRYSYTIQSNGPTSLLEGKLPSKTGRRYIVVGGAGFLGGWIVLHLLQRGEDPRRIRVLDIRPPIRKDLQEGAACDVDFVQVDITNAKAVNAAFRKAWPDSSQSASPQVHEITVFHTAATIRFFERHPSLLHLSERVNLHGTQNILEAAKSIGVRTLIYTSSGSVGVRRTRLWLWPWQKEPKFFTQVINEDDANLSRRHEQFFSNYAVSKLSAERSVRAADQSPSGDGKLRTGCIRPGNGIYGPGGDLVAGSYLIRKYNLTWIGTIVQSFIYVENCSLAHLLYEQRLLELEAGSSNPDIGGRAFCVADSGAPPTYGDMHNALNLLSNGETTFQDLSPTAMLGLAHLVEWYYLTRHFLLASPLQFLGRIMPPVDGDLVFLQPSMWALTNVHLYFDDSSARAPAEKGGLGYTGCTTLEGVCQVVIDHYRTGGEGTKRVIAGHAEAGHSSLVGAEQAIGVVVDKLVDGIDATKALN